MGQYLLIASRDPFDSNDVANLYGLATDLIRTGHEVTMFLVQNGVLPARQSAKTAALTRLAQTGVELLADDFSLRERGIAANRLTPDVKAVSLDVVVDHLAAGRKVLWH